MITTSEAAAILGVTDQRIRQLCKAGRLDAKKFGSKHGGVWMVDRRSVDSYERGKPGRPPKEN